MKLYRSLLFRELKISRRHYAVRILLMGSFAALLFLAVFVAWQEDIANASPQELKELQYIVDMFGVMFALLTAVLVGHDTDVLRSDVNCGWKRYSYALPVTAKDKALAHYSVKGAAILIGGIFCLIFAAVIENPLGQQLVAGTMNVYFMALDVLLLAELLRDLLMAKGLTEKQAKLWVTLLDLLWVVCFAVWVYISFVEDIIENINDMAENGATLSVEFAAGILDAAEGLFIVPFIVLILLAAGSFLAYVRVQERREP